MKDTEAKPYRIPENIDDVNHLSKEECYYLWKDLEAGRVDLPDALISQLSTLLCMIF